MANTIRIKRRATGGAAGAPSTLQNAELAFNENDYTLYYGFGVGTGGNSSQNIAIGGSGAFVTTSTNQTITGDKSFTGSSTFSTVAVNTSITVPTAAVSTNSTAAASTAFVRSAISNYSITTLSVSSTTAASNVLALSINTTNPNSSSSPALVLDLVTQASNRVFAGPTSGTGAPTFRALTEADIPSIARSKITDFDTGVRATRLDQLTAAAAVISMGGYAIQNVGDPQNSSDAATKNYVDTKSSAGLQPKQQVRVATVSNVVLNGTSTPAVDDITLSANDRILVKDQTNATENGIYVFATGAWTRATDADASSELLGAYVFVSEGTANKNNAYTCSNNSLITFGATAINWALFSKIDLTVVAPLTKTGSTISLNTVGVAQGGTGSTSLTGVVVGSGTSPLTAYSVLPVSLGGTGGTSFTGILLGNGTNGFTTTSNISISQGGTGATTASAARTALSAASSGSNSDITSLTGLTTPLSVAQGGTGATSLSGLAVGSAANATYANTAGSATSAGTANNVAGGVVGQLLYQTAAGTTGFISPGTARNVLRSSGPSSAPVFESLNPLTISSGLTGTSYNGSANVTIAVDSSSTGTASKIAAYDSNGNLTASGTLNGLFVNAFLTPPSGNATVAPLKIISVSNGTTSAADGNIENIGNALFFTPSAALGRKQIALTDSTFTGTWNGGVIPPSKGGTGTINSYNIAAAGPVSFYGAGLNTNFTVVGDTSVTLPTSGTLATLTGSESLTNKILSLRAGTTSAAPLVLNSGNNTTTATAGAVEYDGTNLYFTPTTSRKTVAFLDSTFTGTWNGGIIPTTKGGTGVNNSFNITVGGALTTSSTVNISGALATNGAVSIGGTLTTTNAVSVTGALTTNGTVNINGAFATSGNVTIGGAFITSNAVSISGALTTNGAISIGGTLTTTGAISIGSTLTTSGAVNIGGALTTNGAVTFSGSFGSTFTLTGTTSITLPTSGTLATLAGTESLSNKTISNSVLNSSTITLKAGSTSVAPLVLTSGSNTTVPAAGAVEYDGTSLLFTANATRRQIAYVDDTFTGAWNGSIIPASKGGTGVNNGNNNITIGGALTFTGAYSTTLAVTANTSLTLPVSGTLATLAGTESLSNKTINNSSLGSSTISSSTVSLKAGTTSVAPLVLASGANTTSATTGAVEYDGTNLYFTPTTSRKAVAFTDGSTFASASVWNGGIIGAAYGGTGVNNSFTITVGGALQTAGAVTFSGAFGVTLTATGTTSVTLPTTGTLATLAGTETLSNKKLVLSATTTSTGSAPITLASSSGALNSTPQAGSLEYDGSALYFSPQLNERRRLAYVDGTFTSSAVWNGGVIGAAYGGTGISNSFTIRANGPVVFNQAFNVNGSGGLTINTSGTSNVTIPTQGTLLQDVPGDNSLGSIIDGGTF